MRKIFMLLVVLAVQFFMVSAVQSQAACTNVAGFASNCVNNVPVLTLSNPSVSSGTVTLTANVVQSGTNAIYATGYYWSAAQNQWLPFTLTGTAYPGTDGSTWLTNTASKSLSIPTSAAIGGVIYVVTWDYTFSSNNWIGPACSNVAGCWRLATYTIQSQGDTTAPAVSITSPSSGQTVSGTTTVTATASDNVGVAGVQFKVDNVNIGAEDTASPYSVSWTTTGLINGNHVLTAVARDAAGNTAASTGATVNVNNAVSACGSYKTDLGTYTPPPLPSRPALLQQYNDPTFGACVKRVTDNQQLGDKEVVHTYSEMQAWNADGSLILLVNGQIIDANTYQMVHDVNFGYPATGNGLKWSPTDPYVLYYVGNLISGTDPDGITCGVNTARLMRYRLIPGNPMTGRRELVQCFTEYSKFDKDRSWQEMSNDGRYIALLGDKSGGGQEAFLYDVVNKAKLATVPVSFIEWVEPSPLGDYLLVNWANGGEGPTTGVQSYNPQTGARIGQLSTGRGHGSTALAPDGTQWYVFDAFSTSFAPGGNQPQIVKARIPKGYDDWKAGDQNGMVSMLIENWDVGQHISCRTPRGEWCAVSTYAMGTANVPFYHEVFRMSLFSTVQNPKIQRLAHHYSDNLWQYNSPFEVCPLNGYYAQPHASLSRDGSKIIFGSSWGQVCRAEAYIINVS